jgi:hypothetical protein
MTGHSAAKIFVRYEMSNALSLPQDKYDTEAATALAVASWESIAPLMPQILEWMQDLNWPVAHVFQPFLVSVGLPLVPFVREVFATDDEQWKYNILVSVVACAPELATALHDDLKRMANNPTEGERLEGVSEEAREILAN